jgi:hypothetical protein
VLRLSEGYKLTKETLLLVSPDIALVVLVAGYIASTLKETTQALRAAMASPKVSPSLAVGSRISLPRGAVWSLLYDLATCGLMLAALLVNASVALKTTALAGVQR